MFDTGQCTTTAPLPGDQVELAVVEPHAVHELQVGAKHPEVGEPLDVPESGGLQAHLDLALRLGDVDVRADAPLLRQLVGSAHRVRRATPRDQRPEFQTQPTVRRAVPRRPQTRHLRDDPVGRLHEGRMVVDVSPATRKKEADPSFLRGAKNAVVVARLRVDVLMVDHRRRAAPDILHQTEHSGDVSIFFGERLGHRPDGDLEPFEQRFVIGQAAQERLEQVRVGIHHAGHDGHVRRVDDGIRALTQLDGRLAGSERRDPIIDDEHVAGIVDAARVIDRDYGAVLDQNAAQAVILPDRKKPRNDNSDKYTVLCLATILHQMSADCQSVALMPTGPEALRPAIPASG